MNECSRCENPVPEKLTILSQCGNYGYCSRRCSELHDRRAPPQNDWFIWSE